MSNRYQTIIAATRIDISDAPVAPAATSTLDADLTAAVERGQITLRRANRIQAARA